MATIRGARRRLAHLVYPDAFSPLPAPAPTPQPSKPPEPSAANVSYRAATEFFDRRLPNYERLAAASAPYVTQDGVIMDVGANIGYFTKVLAKVTGFGGTAHLFEPLPHLVGHARETASRLPFSAPVHPFGLGDEDTELDLFIGGSNFGWNTMVAERATASMPPVKVTVRRFNPDMIGGRVPSFIKIDVEGAEYKVLGGLLPSLQQWDRRPAILCEIGWGVNHPHWSDELAVFDQLGDLGYQATSLNGAPVELTTIDKTTDVLFLPN